MDKKDDLFVVAWVTLFFCLLFRVLIMSWAHRKLNEQRATRKNWLRCMTVWFLFRFAFCREVMHSRNKIQALLYEYYSRLFFFFAVPFFRNNLLNSIESVVSLLKRGKNQKRNESHIWWIKCGINQYKHTITKTKTTAGNFFHLLTYLHVSYMTRATATAAATKTKTEEQNETTIKQQKL